MKDKIFIDSNIFLYAFSDNDFSKQIIASEIVKEEDSTISVQVINEVSSNLIKKLKLSNSEISEFVDDCYDRYRVTNFSKRVFILSSEIRDKYKFSYYDSLILASVIEAKCTILFSEDMQHNQKIESLTIINPFK